MPHGAVLAVVIFSVGLLSLSGCANGGQGDTDGSTTTASSLTTLAPTTTTTTTTTPCVPAERPAKPKSPFELNGEPWPKMCLTDKREAHFFGIGDWGGDKQDGHTWNNPNKCDGTGRPCQDADHWAQKYVAEMMVALAKDASPDFVLNAGDNFYPGGIDGTCGAGGGDPTGQFGSVFEALYKGEGLTGKPWLGVFGNHDWGGRQFHAGVDVQVLRTWEIDEWRIPALFWSQNVQYDGFSIDFFMLDSNFIDAQPVGSDPNHNICQDRLGGGTNCFGLTESTCFKMFQDFWMGSLKMLEKGLNASTADWKIIVTHFPGPSIGQQPQIQELNKLYGIDLLFTGHTHHQEVGEDKFSGIPFIISGGGGGVTSDSGPQDSGKDNAYGFVHFTATKDTLTYDMHTWGGVKREQIVLSSHKIEKKNGVRQQRPVQFYI